MDFSDQERATPRHFTLDEANALLPRVRELVVEVQTRTARIAVLQARLEAFREQKRRGEHAVEGESLVVKQVLGEAARIAAAIRGSIEDLMALGCELKDVQMGLVDFPARRENRTIYLCWRLGEDEIRYWHELDTGFSGRRPL